MDILKEIARVDAIAKEKKYAGRLVVALRDLLDCSNELARAEAAFNIADVNYEYPECEADALARAVKQMAWADNNARSLLKEIDEALAED